MSTLDRFRLLSPEEKDNIRREIISDCELMTDGGCWIYRGTVNPSGYPIKYIQGRMRPVGRFMLCYRTRESLNFKADACHVKDCPRTCVNPDHLDWGTHGENCKERESTCFRFGHNARKRKTKTRSLARQKNSEMRSLASSQSQSADAAELSSFFS